MKGVIRPLKLSTHHRVSRVRLAITLDGPFPFRGFRRIRGGVGRHELAGGLCVADGGGRPQLEHEGQAQWVGAVGECFVELTVDAEPLDRGGESPEGFSERDLADGPVSTAVVWLMIKSEWSAS